jgi:hypothetical protein
MPHPIDPALPPSLREKMIELLENQESRCPDQDVITSRTFGGSDMRTRHVTAARTLSGIRGNICRGRQRRTLT